MIRSMWKEHHIKLHVLPAPLLCFVMTISTASSLAAQESLRLQVNTRIEPLKLAWAEERNVDAQRAVKSMANSRWYDKETQSYAPPKLSPERDNSIRDSKWLGKVRVDNGSTWNLGIGEFFAEVFAWAAIGIISAALVTGVVLLILHATRNYVPSRLNYSDRQKKFVIDPTRVDELPFDFVALKRDPLAEAEQLWRSGRYNEAMVYLYAYMLLALDQSRHIHLQKGKTNRMYLRELKPLGLKRILEPTMLAFEEVFFGKYDVSKERFELAWGQLELFHKLLAPTSEPVASQSTGRVAPV
jgi:hypothetical protein